MVPVVVQEWLESEAGWGCRPDGFSIHLTLADCQAYCKKYWEDEKKANKGGGVPHEYSREAGNPTVVDVDEKVYKALVEAKKRNIYGIRVWCRDIKKIYLDPAFASPLDLANEKGLLLDNKATGPSLWAWKEAPQEFRSLTGVDTYSWVAYIPPQFVDTKMPFGKSSKIKTLKSGGKLKFFK